MSCNDELDFRKHPNQVGEHFVLMDRMEVQVYLIHYYYPAYGRRT